MTKVTENDLTCLIRWPDNSVGYVEEVEALRVLLALCEKHGFGRIPQLASQIEEIWRNPEAKKKFEKERQEFIGLMQSF